jgi:hypothetical protein
MGRAGTEPGEVSILPWLLSEFIEQERVNASIRCIAGRVTAAGRYSFTAPVIDET